MEHAGWRAVIATADISSAGPMLEVLKKSGITPCAVAASGDSALEKIREILPDLVIADLVLPGIDGIHLARRVLELPVTRHPAVILLDPAGGMVFGDEWLFGCGVTVLSKPFAPDGLTCALQALIPENRSLPPDRKAQLASLMDELGVPDHPGRQYLSDAAALVWMDSRFLNSLKAGLYTSVAHKNSTDAARVERAMRYAIDSAWRNGEIARQHRIFGDTIDARRGKPTCGEMIARLADILRWEGRQ